MENNMENNITTKKKLKSKLNKRIGKRAMTKDVIKMGTIIDINIVPGVYGELRAMYMLEYDDKVVRYTPESNIVLLKEANK